MLLAVLTTALAALALPFAIHVLWWRLQRPKDDLKILALLIVAMPPLLALASLLVTQLSLAEGLLAFIASGLLGATYLFWYPAAQAASPTMLITLEARRHGAKGVSASELQACMPDEQLVREGIDNLFHENFAREHSDGHLSLTPRGQRTQGIITQLRKAAGFGAPKG
jgi:hypothetical protein